MKALFAISIVALLALLWASISIAQHVRRARRRRRAVVENSAVVQRLAEVVEHPAAGAHPPPPPPPPPPPDSGLKDDGKHELGDLSDPYEERLRKSRTP